MTLQDFKGMLKHYWILFLGLPLMLALLAFAASSNFLPQEYEATASVTALDPSGKTNSTSLVSVLKMTSNEVKQESNEQSDGDVALVVEMGTGANAQTVTFQATGVSREECLEVANAAANEAAVRAKSAFDDLEKQYEESVQKRIESVASAIDSEEDLAFLAQSVIGGTTYSLCSFIVDEAKEPMPVSPSKTKSVLAGLFVGLFLAAVIVLVRDAYFHPIRSKSQIEDTTGLRVVAWPGVENRGDRLLAASYFSSDSDMKVVSLAPLGCGDCASIAEELVSAAELRGFESSMEVTQEWFLGRCEKTPGNLIVRVGAPLSQSVGSLFAYSQSDATFICVKEWVDRVDALEDAISELKMADARIAGIVLVSG